MSDPRPIGVFDSGVGGLTVARALIDLLPDERIVYVGDTAHGPYGPRPLGEVRDLTSSILEWLTAQDVKLTVAACNTASAAALDVDPVDVSVPTIGVIDPAVRAAAAATRSGVVGVIGTVGTIASGAYDRAFARIDPRVRVVSQACPRFVELVEAGRTTDPVVFDVAEEYLAGLRREAVDVLVLGCTHYPLLTGVLGHVMGPEVVLVSSAETAARSVFSRLVDSDALRERPADADAEAAHRFVATGDGAAFATLATRFLGPRIPTVEVEAIPGAVPAAAGGGSR